MKNLLLNADAPEGGGGTDELAKLISRFEALNARMIIIEKSKDLDALTKRVGGLETAIKALKGLDDKIADIELKLEEQAKAQTLPTEIRLGAPVIKSTTQHYRDELAELESAPERRLALLTDGGLNEDQAQAHITGRIKYLRLELGIKAIARKTGKAAALIIGLLMLAFAFAPTAQADNQGLNTLFVNTRVYSFTLTLTNQQTQSAFFTLANQLNGAGYHVVGVWLTTPGIPGTNAPVTLKLVGAPNTSASQNAYLNGVSGAYTNAAAGTNQVWTTAPVLTLSGTVESTTQTVYTNLLNTQADSVGQLQGASLATTATNIAGGIYQVDIVLTP